MALRDHLLESCLLEMLGPCLHEKPCPMLAGTRQDWCHFYVDWPEPSYLKQLDRLVGNENRFLKLSYLLMSPPNAFPIHRNRRPYQYRVVSNRMATRGKTEVVLCGEPGRIRLTLLHRDQSPTNQILKKIRRGDLLEWKEWEESSYTVNGHYRLQRSSVCKKLTC
jgi:ribosomal protein RSM22 (predicted rRNA methylase)